MISISDLWYSGTSAEWESALERYWQLVKPSNLNLERRLESLDLKWIGAMDAQAWYEFLRDDYFRWKYTAANRYATTTRALRRYVEENRLDDLYRLKQELLSMHPVDTRGCLSLASTIQGLGTAGASGLLALMYSEHFGTVDQFVVKALKNVPDLPEAAAVAKMNMQGLSLEDGLVLIRIMQHKATENNRLFGTDSWTPRKIDKVLWTYGR